MSGARNTGTAGERPGPRRNAGEGADRWSAPSPTRGPAPSAAEVRRRGRQAARGQLQPLVEPQPSQM